MLGSGEVLLLQSPTAPPCVRIGLPACGLELRHRRIEHVRPSETDSSLGLRLAVLQAQRALLGNLLPDLEANRIVRGKAHLGVGTQNLGMIFAEIACGLGLNQGQALVPALQAGQSFLGQVLRPPSGEKECPDATYDENDNDHRRRPKHDLAQDGPPGTEIMVPFGRLTRRLAPPIADHVVQARRFGKAIRRGRLVDDLLLVVLGHGPLKEEASLGG